MVGVGKALNPWDHEIHVVWIQCCPVLLTGDVDKRTIAERLHTYFGESDRLVKRPPIYSHPHDRKIAGEYGYSVNDSHLIDYPDLNISALAVDDEHGGVGGYALQTQRLLQYIRDGIEPTAMRIQDNAVMRGGAGSHKKDTKPKWASVLQGGGAINTTNLAQMLPPM